MPKKHSEEYDNEIELDGTDEANEGSDIDDVDDVEDIDEIEATGATEQEDEEEADVEKTIDNEEDAGEALDESDASCQDDEEEQNSKNTSKNKCVYNFVPGKTMNTSIDELKHGINLNTYANIKTFVDKKDRVSKPFLTKYEFVRIIGTRSQQLIMGAKPMIKNYKKYSPKECAVEELKARVTPFYIEREMPNGTIEKWDVNELKYLEI